MQIETFERIPPVFTGRYEWYNFKETSAVPPHVIEDLKAHATDWFYQAEHDNLVYRIRNESYPSNSTMEQRVALRKKHARAECAPSKQPVVEKIAQDFEPNLRFLEERVGKPVTLAELPITFKFRDFSQPTCHFKDGVFELWIIEEGPNMGSAGGPSTSFVALIGKMRLSVNGKPVTAHCEHCGHAS
jgi:hypothetical protein